ncbi:Clp protease ClpP [Rhizobium sp. CFBP 8762]|uniref:head maturation protease, ClpP-related n=1 Tax=Rhizobium sp. CFBP 8762 TaxID=2775279 RepID=UPI00177DA14C|nr:head maturation protease, ClpP-related [Rhizobium sp. CFBP 8762]MBD8555546.1 Clp protease ClpP [Rhizobium sp. CFBP 8762]
MAAILEDGRLRLTGYVGDYYFDDGFTASDVVLALGQIEDDAELTVHINSPGGIATDGAAIHAMLTARIGTTNVVVEGIAASAASLIAMAGETVTMSAGAIMMIHDPSTYTFGTSSDLSKTIEGLEALATAYSRVYAAKSGKSADECRTIMKEERWLTPEEAVDQGFADDTTETKAAPVAAFDYRTFAHAPKKLVALAKRKDWSEPGVAATATAAHAATTRSKQEIVMTDKERADQLAAENAQLKTDLETAKASATTAVTAALERRTSIMALDEAKGRETLAEHLFNTGMSVDDAKVTLAAAPAAATDTTQPPTNDYERARLEASRLVTPTGGKPAPTARVDIVADMKRRHGIS